MEKLFIPLTRIRNSLALERLRPLPQGARENREGGADD